MTADMSDPEWEKKLQDHYEECGNEVEVTKERHGQTTVYKFHDGEAWIRTEDPVNTRNKA